MDSINRYTVERRIARVYDTMAGAQCTQKGVKEYVKILGNAVGIKRTNAGTEDDFLRDFGRGI